jgi:uncharacterized caspase-like protein
MRPLFFAAAVAASLLILHAQAAGAGSRVALVVGVSSYRHAPSLSNPINDASDLRSALRELGFEVLHSADADKAALDRSIRAFSKRISSADVALIFFAGHGLQVAGQNYLMPIDAKLESERDLEFETVRLDFILGQLQAGRAGKTSIIMLDACRDNPLARNLARSMGVRSDAYARGLAAVDAGAGTFIAFSTAPGKVAYDGQGRNSPFAAALLRHIRSPAQGLNALMIEVRKDVMAATGNAQVPWDHSAMTQDFQFLPGSRMTTGSIPFNSPSGPDDARREERARRLEEELGLRR